MALQKWVRRHPVAALFAWFFPVGWTIAFIPAIARALSGVELPFEPFLIVANAVGLLLPTLVITRIVDGAPGVTQLMRRVTDMRHSLGWYALALVPVPLLSLGMAVAVYGAPEASGQEWLQALASGLLLQTAVGLFTTNLWEETAWMGFIQTRLQTSHGVLLAAVITAALFALQHLPLAVENPSGVIVLLALFVLAIPFRALLAWIYNRTGSLFLVGLLHAVGDATAAGALAPGFLPRLFEASDVQLFPLLANALLGLAVIAITRAHLGRPAVSASQALSPVPARWSVESPRFAYPRLAQPRAAAHGA